MNEVFARLNEAAVKATDAMKAVVLAYELHKDQVKNTIRADYNRRSKNRER